MAFKKLILICYCGLLSAFSLLTAQGSTYSFKPFKHLEHTAIKNQHQTGTCWAFSTASFLESEVKRISQMDVDLSEMFIVRQVYKKKCEMNTFPMIFVETNQKNQYIKVGGSSDLETYIQECQRLQSSPYSMNLIYSIYNSLFNKK
jgi:hypothetical protein